jgi:UDP-glucose 4-epimerase
MKKILVTGGAGFIGAHLVNRILREKKYLVLIVDNLKTKGGIPYINPNAKFIKGDILEKKILKKIEKWKPDIIYHLAAQSGGEGSYDDPKLDYLVNGYGTLELAKLASKVRCKKFIYTSTVAVYGSSKGSINENSKLNPDSFYGISKLAGEMFLKQILKDSEVQTYIFRLFNTFGPGENLNNTKKGMVGIYSYYIWKNTNIISRGSLDRYRNFVFIDDCVEILFRSIKNKNLKSFEIINLTSGKKVKVKSLINIMLKINNKKNLKVIVKKNTPGDSFGLHSSNSYLLKKFKSFKFSNFKRSLIRYFDWIKILPLKNNLKNHHPFKK